MGIAAVLMAIPAALVPIVCMNWRLFDFIGLDPPCCFRYGLQDDIARFRPPTGRKRKPELFMASGFIASSAAVGEHDLGGLIKKIIALFPSDNCLV